MNKPPLEYNAFKKFIDNNHFSIKFIFFALIKIPFDFIELIIKNFPGSLGFLLRRIYYKLRLKKMGKNVFIDIGVNFFGYNNIEIDDFCYIDKYCLITSISKINIGKRVHLGAFSIVHAGINAPIEIGNFAGLSCNTKIYSISESYKPNKRMSGPMIKDVEKHTISSPIKLEDECFLGPNCLILPGANIGYGSIISANTVVKKNIGELEIVNSLGKKIKKRIFNKDLFKY